MDIDEYLIVKYILVELRLIIGCDYNNGVDEMLFLCNLWMTRRMSLV